MRDSTGQDSNEITAIVGTMPVPTIDARTSSRITGGSVMARSTRRMMAPSTTRPLKDDTAPTRKPMTRETATDVIATSSEIRPPCIRRARTSRPTPSVPNQWLALGPLLRARRSIWLGE